eukprot:COSAG05_NODE_6227_length_995_cov_1.729911_2_plen_85_part_00
MVFFVVSLLQRLAFSRDPHQARWSTPELCTPLLLFGVTAAGLVVSAMNAEYVRENTSMCVLGEYGALVAVYALLRCCHNAAPPS